MKQKLYYFAAVVIAQCIWALPLYFLSKSDDVICFSSMTSYGIACFIGDVTIVGAFISNKIIQGLLVGLCVGLLLIGCVLFLFGVLFPIAMGIGPGMFPAALLYIMYFVIAGSTLSEKISAFMMKKKWLQPNTIAA